MLPWLQRLFRRSDPPAELRAQLPALLAEWFTQRRQAGKPKGLTWVQYESLGRPIVGNGWAVVEVMVLFEPTADGPLADVSQANGPRGVVAVFRYTRRRWTAERVVFNLSAEQVAEQFARHKSEG
ncbi:MAG: hypothetical protein MUF18_20315 [Fimbriiglobus sp.]|nr:hypothetical protein [Fimbriiglobus sp.]